MRKVMAKIKMEVRDLAHNVG